MKKIQNGEAMTQVCRKKFGDDFVNRIDEFIVFAKLEEHDLERTAVMRLDSLSDRLKSIDVDLSYEDDVPSVIVSNVMREEKPNIKSVDRFVRRFVESKISSELASSSEPIHCLTLGTY